jgi:heat shock protein 4
MSVVGCDFGTLNTVIAVARNRGVDVVSFVIFARQSRSNMMQITNEVSNRATPYVVENCGKNSLTIAGRWSASAGKRDT